ncbi:MAG: Zinc finger, C2H2 type [Halorubrum sp. J07HR59]|nr:MAG: Zinc finger, C2H2 type [Halorubrum sp. J07HR59]
MCLFIDEECRDVKHSCSDCDAEFSSAAGISQHVALHHRVCAACDQSFDAFDTLREHIHSAH